MMKVRETLAKIKGIHLYKPPRYSSTEKIPLERKKNIQRNFD